MNIESIRRLLDQVRDGAVTTDEALSSLRHLPYEDLGYAKLDHHRALRTGAPEVVFCQGKRVEQVVGIIGAFLERAGHVLATRVQPEQVAPVLAAFPAAVHHDVARVIEAGSRPATISGRYVLVVSAGTADLPVAEEAAVTAEALGSTVTRLYDVGVAGLHRLLAHRDELFAASAVVVVAGMEGALPSVVSGLVSAPVVAVPTSVGYGANFGGLAPLLSMLNTCAPGVATVNIDNGFGGGYFAHMINATRST